MINVIVHGLNGKMGKVLARLLQEDTETKIIAGIDKNIDSNAYSFPVYEKASECIEKGDVVIDFSHHSALKDIVNYCVNTKTSLVTATTGLSGEDTSILLDASKKIPVFHSGNMSLGINVLIDLAKSASKAFGDNFDIEIIEKHHNQKVDSPSGTAYMIANEINDVFNNNKDFVYGRHGKNDNRKNTDIGIHAIRGGSISGEHTVLFAGKDEIIEIKHTALSKDIFALGAIKAAKFLSKQQNGFYNMNDMIK
ncbi:4-hydroxy-tetrahydrodipicolinate reductase [Lutibacter sp. B2]|nr:4-hydroxy-tetrahydrodipicolinate reductase [Lutibacter sp. B2]